MSRVRTAALNVRALILFLLVLVLLGGGLVGGHYVRKSMTANAALRAGREAAKAGDWEQAARSLRIYVMKYPEDTAVLREYADAELAVRPRTPAHMQAAAGALRRMRAEPTNAQVMRDLIRAYQYLHLYDDVRLIAERRLTADPADELAALALADALIQQGKFADAANRLQDLVERAPDAIDAYGLLSALCLRDPAEADLTKSRAWQDQAVEKNPSSALARVRRASFDLTESQLPQANVSELREKARNDLEAAEKLPPDDPRARLECASIWMELGEYARAEQQLALARTADTDGLARAYNDTDDWQALLAALDADLALRSNKGPEALPRVQQALAQLTQPQHRLYALPWVVRLCLGCGRVAEARTAVDELVKLCEGRGNSVDSLFDATVLHARAAVALAEQHPYDVIALLQPAADRGLLKQPAPSDAAIAASIWRLLGEAYAQTDQLRRAALALRQCARLQPQDTELPQRLARLYAMSGDWDRVRDAAAVGTDRGRTSLALRLLDLEAQAQLALRLPEAPQTAALESVLRDLDQLKRDAPERAVIRVLRAAVSEQLQCHADAESELKSAIAECSDPLPAKLQLARYYARADRFSEAQTLLQAACDQAPDSGEAWTLLAELLADRGQVEQAVAALEKGAEKALDTQQSHKLRLRAATLCLARGARQQGLERLRALAKQRPEDAAVRGLLLDTSEVRADVVESDRLLNELKQIEHEGGLRWRFYRAVLDMGRGVAPEKRGEVTKLLRECLEGDPTWAAPALALGRFQEQGGDLRAAEQVYRDALRSAGEIEIADALLSLLTRERRYSEAAQVLEGQQGLGSELLPHRIAIAMGRGRADEAIEALRLRIGNEPGDNRSRVLLARLLYARGGDEAGARTLLDEAEKREPGSLEVAAARAAILLAEKKPDEARKLLDQRVGEDTNLDALRIRAAFFNQTDDLASAEQDYRLLAEKAEDASGFAMLGAFYGSQRRFEEAGQAWETGLKKFPGNLGLRRALANLYLSADYRANRQRGNELLAGLLQSDPENPEFLRLQAGVLLEQGGPQELRQARGLLEHVISQDPSDIEAYRRLVALALHGDELAAARTYANAAVAALPESAAALMCRARVERASRDLNAAKQSARQALQLQPQNREARELLAEMALAAGDKSALGYCLEIYNAQLVSEPDSGLLVAGKARILAALDRQPEAVQLLEAFCQPAPNRELFAALLTLADFKRLAGDFAAARDCIEKAAALRPDDTAVLEAWLLWDDGQKLFDDLAQRAEAGLAARLENWPAVRRAADMLARHGPAEQNRALRLRELLVERLPTSIDLREAFAVALYTAGALDRAEAQYAAILDLAPTSAKVLNNLAWVKAERAKTPEDLQAALTFAERGLEQEPTDVNLLDTRAFILSKLPGKLEQARVDYQQVFDFSKRGSPERARAALKLARVCKQLGDSSAVKACLEEAARIDAQQPSLSEAERAELKQLSN